MGKTDTGLYHAGYRQRRLLLALLLIAALFVLCGIPCESHAAAKAKYKTMNGRVVQAQGGDHGKVVGGKPGDQSGSELTTSKYSYSR